MQFFFFHFFHPFFCLYFSWLYEISFHFLSSHYEQPLLKNVKIVYTKLLKDTRFLFFIFFFLQRIIIIQKNNDSFSQFIASISNPPTYSLFSEKEIYVHWIISRKSIEINVTFLEHTFFKHTRASIHLFSQSARGNCEKRNISLFYPHLSVSFSQTCKGARKKGGGGECKGKDKKVATQTRRHTSTSHFYFCLAKSTLSALFPGQPFFFKRIFPNWLGTRKKNGLLFLCLWTGDESDWGRLSTTFFN